MSKRQQDGGGVGSHKHHVSGHPGQSPRSRVNRELDIRQKEKSERRTRSNCAYDSVASLMGQEVAPKRKKRNRKK
ncbi:hypothetical protein CL630_01585 [bacterium]|mgnify:FL=1|nr:hypothetical protein [bacterium]|tara:strand:+ start:11303 stop:11527 length:225 start_codon:yes stop_codon:yes gene_type:complete